MNELVRGLDMESDMLQRYTQHTIVDDLLPPESTLPLLSQEVDIETRRGGTSFLLHFTPRDIHREFGRITAGR